MSVGDFSGIVTVLCDDGDEGVYTFSVSGTGEPSGKVASWDDETEPKVIDSTSTTITFGWSYLENATEYEVYDVSTYGPPVSETLIDTTSKNSITILRNSGIGSYRIKALDNTTAILDMRVIYQGNFLSELQYLTGTVTDNFDDDFIDPLFIMKPIGKYTEDNGYLELEIIETDNPPALYIGYNHENKRYIRISVDWYQHRANDYSRSVLRIFSYSNNLDTIEIFNAHESYAGWYGTGIGFYNYDEQNYILLPFVNT